MSTHPVIRTSVDPQLGSKLLLAPYDIRRAIYIHLITNQVHVFLRQGKIHLSVCVEPSPPGDLYGFERRTSGDWWSDTIWARRLRSSWGPHWKCEEVASRINDNYKAAYGINVAVLLVCKRMYIDVVDFTADLAVFNVTDLNTLNCLLQRAGTSSSGISSASSFLTSVLPYIRKLNITLRLPLPICKALENLVADSSPRSPPAGALTAGWTSQLTIWLRLCPAIAQLKELRRLRIWLDHNDQSSWSIVNERAILSPLTPLTSISNLNISINLPKLHPHLERPDRHFGEDSPAPIFKIHRRLRQRYHSKEDSKGRFRVTYEADFPLLLDCPGLEDTPQAEIEELERSLWKKGVNVDKELSDGVWVCY